MAIPFDAYLAPLTQEQVEQSIYNLLGSIGIPASSWQQGSVTRGIISITSRMISGSIEIISIVVKGTFLDYAEGIYLTALASYVYNVVRDDATFATGVVVVDNASANTYTFQPGELLFYNNLTQKEFKNTSIVNIGANQQDVNADVIAQEAGSSSTSTPGSINSFVTPRIGLTCTNPSALVGTDEESDEDLRQRCRDALGALSPNGPKEAYAYVAKSATRPSDGTPIGVNRVSVSADSGTGVVTVYVADPDGPLTGPDLAIVDAEIQEKVVPIGITANVFNATALTTPVTATVWAKKSANVTSGQIQTAIANALVTYFQNIPIGGDPLVDGGSGYLSFTDIISVIDNANSAIYKINMVTPSADVLLTPDQVPVLGTVTITVNIV